MSRRARFLTAILCLLVAGAMAATFVFASGDSGADASKAKKASGFTPAKIAGKWIGAWKNITFGSEGSIRANVQAKPQNKMLLLADFGGTSSAARTPPRRRRPCRRSPASTAGTETASGFPSRPKRWAD